MTSLPLAGDVRARTPRPGRSGPASPSTSAGAAAAGKNGTAMAAVTAVRSLPLRPYGRLLLPRVRTAPAPVSPGSAKVTGRGTGGAPSPCPASPVPDGCTPPPPSSPFPVSPLPRPPCRPSAAAGAGGRPPSRRWGCWRRRGGAAWLWPCPSARPSPPASWRCTPPASPGATADRCQPSTTAGNGGDAGGERGGRGSVTSVSSPSSSSQPAARFPGVQAGLFRLPQHGVPGLPQPHRRHPHRGGGQGVGRGGEGVFLPLPDPPHHAHTHTGDRLAVAGDPGVPAQGSSRRR